MPPQFGTKIDSRDGKRYRTVLMPDGNWWLAEDVEYAGTASPYLGWYSWEEMTQAVIPGCHCPIYNGNAGIFEWNDLVNATGGFGTWGEDPNAAGLHLKATSGWGANGDDLYGFNAINKGYYVRETFTYNWFYSPGNQNNNGTLYFYDWQDSQWQFKIFWLQNNYQAPSAGGLLDKYGNDGRGISSQRLRLRLIVDEGNIPDPIIPQIYGTDFDGFERDASVRIERNIRWVDSVGGGVQGIPTMGASLDTWQVSASLRVSQARAAAIEAAVGPYIGQVAPSLVLPHRMGENSFPGLVPSTIAESGDIYANPCIQGAGFRSNGRVAVVTDLFDYGLDYDLTACPTGGDANGATTPITTAPAWLAGKFAQHSITDASNERRAIKADGYFNPLLYSAKHGRRFDYTIHLDLLSQAQADQLVAYFRGVRHEAHTVYLEFGTEGFASKAIHFRELSFQRNGIHWDGELQITLARS